MGFNLSEANQPRTYALATNLINLGRGPFTFDENPKLQLCCFLGLKRTSKLLAASGTYSVGFFFYKRAGGYM